RELGGDLLPAEALGHAGRIGDQHLPQRTVREEPLNGRSQRLGLRGVDHKRALLLLDEARQVTIRGSVYQDRRARYQILRKLSRKDRGHLVPAAGILEG